MTKLVSIAVVGFALASIGCQPAAPPQAPQAGPTSPPPAAPPGGGKPEMMALHHECACGMSHEGGEAAEHHHDGGDERMAHGEHRGRLGMHGEGHPGVRGSEPKGPGGGHGVMRELAALGVRFYPAPMLLYRAQEIGLTPDQVTKIRQEMLGTQAHAVDVVAKLQHTKLEVVRLLSADKVDEHAVDAQIDDAAKAAAELHKLHIGSMLRVRALLTPEQRQKLEEHKPGHEGSKAAPGAHAPEEFGEPEDEDDEEDAWEG